jgi:TonB family protein
MVRNRITMARSPARAAHAGLLPGLSRLKLTRVRDPAKAVGPAALPDPARLKFARDEAWPRPQAENSSVLLAGAGVALAAHALALWLLLPRAAPELPSGAGGQYLEAIEVTLVASPVIESRNRKPEEKPSGARSEPAPNDGERSKAVAAAPPTDTPKQAEEPLRKRESRANPANDGATARAVEDEGRASGPASASPGAIQQYAAKVREALARNKPSGFGNRGTATIKFSVSPAGKAGSVEVANSSGIAALDQSAMDAVSRTLFPEPPAGMSEAQRTYAVPFHFK